MYDSNTIEIRDTYVQILTEGFDLGFEEEYFLSKGMQRVLGQIPLGASLTLQIEKNLVNDSKNIVFYGKMYTLAAFFRVNCECSDASVYCLFNKLERDFRNQIHTRRWVSNWQTRPDGIVDLN